MLGAKQIATTASHPEVKEWILGNKGKAHLNLTEHTDLEEIA
jgi:hypothetical protein